jgi:hypothetical protein
MIYKFVKHEIPPLENLKNTFAYQLHEKLERGEKLTRDDKDFAFRQIHTNIYSKAGIALHGWMFNYQEWLNEYWVEFDYGGNLVYERYFAFDKTSIRSELSNISRIVEVK